MHKFALQNSAKISEVWESYHNFHFAPQILVKPMALQRRHIKGLYAEISDSEGSKFQKYIRRKVGQKDRLQIRVSKAERMRKLRLPAEDPNKVKTPAPVVEETKISSLVRSATKAKKKRNRVHSLKQSDKVGAQDIVDFPKDEYEDDTSQSSSDEETQDDRYAAAWETADSDGMHKHDQGQQEINGIPNRPEGRPDKPPCTNQHQCSPPEINEVRSDLPHQSMPRNPLMITEHWAIMFLPLICVLFWKLRQWMEKEFRGGLHLERRKSK